MLKKKEISTPPTVPPPALDPKAVAVAFEKWGRPTLERNRYFLVILFLSAALVALGFAVAGMMPLKTVVPYVIKVSSEGVVVADPAASRPYEPGEAEKKYFLAEWVRHTWSVDKRLTRGWLEKAYSKTRDKAVSQFQELIEAAKPIARLAEDPGFGASVKVKSLNFIDKDTAIVRFEVTERSSMNPDRPKKTQYVMTAHYVIDPPKTEKEIMENPIGFFITDFSVTREL